MISNLLQFWDKSTISYANCESMQNRFRTLRSYYPPRSNGNQGGRTSYWPAIFMARFLILLVRNLQASPMILSQANLEDVLSGYLAWQLPAAYLLQRLPIRWHLSIAIVAWGTILACHAACHDFASLAVCRFLLGVTESVNVPAFTLITGMYYKREEQTARVSLWFGTVGLAQVNCPCREYLIQSTEIALNR
jgi:MFS family permease